MHKKHTHKKVIDIPMLLHDVGLKATPKRIDMFNILSKHTEPISVSTIASSLGTKLDEVTIYRTLESFVASGLVQHVMISSERSYYELVREHHHHVVCTTCGETEDVSGCGIKKLSNRIIRTSSKFAMIRDHSLEFFGVCKKCA